MQKSRKSGRKGFRPFFMWCSSFSPSSDPPSILTFHMFTSDETLGLLQKEPEKRKSQGFFARMCCGAPEAESSAPSATSATPPSRASSNERSPGRRSLDRPSHERHSMNPMAAILSAVQGSVGTVACGSRANEFKDIASRCGPKGFC